MATDNFSDLRFRLKCLLTFFVLLLTFYSCGSHEKDDIISSLNRYDRYLLNLETDSLAGIFAEDGELGQEGQPSISGRETIRTYMKSFAGIRIFENRSESESIKISGDSAVQKGRYTQKLLFNNDTVSVIGEFNAVWVADNSNNWLIRRMIMKPETGNQ